MEFWCGHCVLCCFCFFKQKTAYEMRISDWSSDVCSSDLNLIANAVVWTMIGAGLGLIAIYVWRSRTHAMPIVDLNLLRITSFRISTTGGSLYRVATGAYTLLMPLMLQLGFGYSAAASGGIPFASAAGAMLMKTTAPRIVKRFGFRSLLLDR